MPYPMIECPTFAEFRARLYSEFEVEFKSFVLSESDPPITFFERTVNDITLQCVVAFDDDALIVEPHMIRNICDRLNIPKAAFGLTLG